MPVSIIVGFKIIKVEHHHTQVSSITLITVNFVLECLRELTVIKDFC